MTSQFPETLLQFIESCIPTYRAAELLLFFAAHRDCSFTPTEVVASIRPIAITVPAAEEYASLFAARGLLSEIRGSYRYEPSRHLEPRIAELAHAYNQKPVSLIRAIHQLAAGQHPASVDVVKRRNERHMTIALGELRCSVCPAFVSVARAFQATDAQLRASRYMVT